MGNRLISAFSGCAFIFAASGAAFAADMPLKAPPPAPAPVAFSWTSLYIGFNVGAVFGRHQWRSANQFGTPTLFGEIGAFGADYDFTNFLAGGQVGANYQIGSIVLGVQGDFDAINKTAFAAACNQPIGGGKIGAITRCQSDTQWVASATARVGYAWDRVLPYVKGGAAWARDVYDFGRGEPQNLAAGFPFFETETTRTGWTVGAGVEYAFLPNLGVFLEYDYYNFGTEQINLTPTPLFGPVINIVPAEPMKIALQIQTVKVGLNFLFH